MAEYTIDLETARKKKAAAASGYASSNETLDAAQQAALDRLKSGAYGTYSDEQFKTITDYYKKPVLQQATQREQALSNAMRARGLYDSGAHTTQLLQDFQNTERDLSANYDVPLMQEQMRQREAVAQANIAQAASVGQQGVTNANQAQQLSIQDKLAIAAQTGRWDDVQTLAARAQAESEQNSATQRQATIAGLTGQVYGGQPVSATSLGIDTSQYVAGTDAGMAIRDQIKKAMSDWGVSLTDAQIETLATGGSIAGVGSSTLAAKAQEADIAAKKTQMATAAQQWLTEQTGLVNGGNPLAAADLGLDVTGDVDSATGQLTSKGLDDYYKLVDALNAAGIKMTDDEVKQLVAGKSVKPSGMNLTIAGRAAAANIYFEGQNLTLQQAQDRRAELNDAMTRAQQRGAATGEFVDPVTRIPYQTLAARAQKLAEVVAQSEATGVWPTNVADYLDSDEIGALGDATGDGTGDGTGGGTGDGTTDTTAVTWAGKDEGYVAPAEGQHRYPLSNYGYADWTWELMGTEGEVDARVTRLIGAGYLQVVGNQIQWTELGLPGKGGTVVATLATKG